MSYTYTENENIIDIFENDIDKYITMYCEKCNISDLTKESQNRFTGLLGYLQQKVFRHYNFYSNINPKWIDYKKLFPVLDFYIHLCDEYDKMVSSYGFSRMIGIDENTLYFTDYRDRASADGVKILKRLNAERERTLSERLASGKVNPVGVLGCLNHWHGWSGVGNMTENREKQVATLETVRGMVPELSDNSTAAGQDPAGKIDTQLNTIQNPL